MVSVSPSAADPRPDSLAVHSYGVAFAPLVTEGCRPPRAKCPDRTSSARESRNSVHRGTPCHTACFPHEREPVTGTMAPLEREQFMRNKLLVSTAVLAAAIAVASCEDAERRACR